MPPLLWPLALSSLAGAAGRQSAAATRLSSAPAWACAKCRRTLSSSRNGMRFSSTSPSNAGSRSSPRSRRALILTASGGAAAATALAFTDDIKRSYETAERTGRVASALVLCINDYRKTLNIRETMDDRAEKEELLKACHKRCAVRTLRVLEKNGGIFIKLGQHLSAMNYLLPPEWTTTFIPLQDQCPVSSYASIEQMYRADTGRALLDDFSEFATEPIGAASLAQVHLATIRATGQQVAVKVQHPGLAQWAPLDMALTLFTFSTLKRVFPDYDLEWLSSEMEVSLPEELDFAREAANARRTQQHFDSLPSSSSLPLIIPDVIWAQQRILVMARESGHRLDDLAYLDRHGIDRDEVSAALSRIFNEMIFGDGAPLHCDPHGGNLAVRWRDPAAAAAKNSWRLARWLRCLLPPWRNNRCNFDIILYDHGLYRDIPLELRRAYAHMWLAVLDGDLARMATYAKQVANVDERDFPLFASAITGRDFRVLQRAGGLMAQQPRSDDERDHMSRQLQDGMLTDLMQLLGRVPRVMLLIFKTNDLTRSLDENLHTRLGAIGPFLIMAQYCLRTVYAEQVECILHSNTNSSLLLWPGTALRLLGAWLQYARGSVGLEAFDLWLRGRRLLGLQTNFAMGV